MKILITGAAGFIGMHTALKLLADGHEVIGIDNLNSYYDVNLKLARLAHLTSNAHFVFQQLSIENRTEMAELFERIKPHRVIHLAAQPGVRHSLTHPHSYIYANLQGFMNVYEAIRHRAPLVRCGRKRKLTIRSKNYETTDMFDAN